MTEVSTSGFGSVLPFPSVQSTGGAAPASLQSFGTGGGNGGGEMLEARVARLESDVDYIKRDVGEIKGDVKELSGKVDRINTRLAYATGGVVAGAAILSLVIGIFGWIITNNFQVALEVAQKAQ